MFIKSPTDGEIHFSQFSPFYEVKFEKLPCKTNLKLNRLKLKIKTKYFHILIDDIKIEKLSFFANLSFERILDLIKQTY